jgi:hypothetical protein
MVAPQFRDTPVIRDFDFRLHFLFSHSFPSQLRQKQLSRSELSVQSGLTKYVEEG